VACSAKDNIAALGMSMILCSTTDFVPTSVGLPFGAVQSWRLGGDL